METSSQNKVKQWMHTHKAIVRIVITIVILLLAGTIYYLQRKEQLPADVTNFSVEFEKDQEKDVPEEHVDAGIKIPGYTIIPIAANTKDVSVDLENPAENNVYFQITFLLTDTGEQIYQSKLLSPGQHLYEITLARELEAADYDLTIQYDTFGTDEAYTPRNGAVMNCILHVSE